jgi:hypothetical protein
MKIGGLFLLAGFGSKSDSFSLFKSIKKCRALPKVPATA